MPGVKSIFLISGEVIRGKGRGRNLGFPTLNLKLKQGGIPLGVYTALSRIDKKTYKSVSFVGAAETFGESEILVETFVFDFDEDIYGKTVEIEFLKKTRGQDTFRFDTELELVKRIEQDKKEALEYFAALAF
jgi:riboflavin kinase/FMN adenylyltransferase